MHLFAVLLCCLALGQASQSGSAGTDGGSATGATPLAAAVVNPPTKTSEPSSGPSSKSVGDLQPVPAAERDLPPAAESIRTPEPMPAWPTATGGSDGAADPRGLEPAKLRPKNDLPLPTAKREGSGEALPGQSPGGSFTDATKPAEAPPPVRPLEPTAPAAAALVPVESVRAPLAARQIVLQLLSLPAEGKLSGRQLTLLEALSSGGRGRGQLEVLHAYWRLVGRVGEYRVCRQQVDELERLEARPQDLAVLRAARMSAVASLRQAELGVVSGQHELAELASLPAAEPLPLPADRPHVGPYHTHFERIFSTRPAPARARLIHRTLPVRRSVIEARSAAVQAAEDALASATEGYRRGELELETVLSCTAQLGRGRRELIGSVSSYNHDIADYALSTVDLPADGQALVGMLIKPKQAAPKPRSEGSNSAAPDRSESTQPPREPSAVRAATFERPAIHTPEDPRQPAGMGKPRLAPPRRAAEPAVLENGRETTSLLQHASVRDAAKDVPAKRGVVLPPIAERPIVPVPPRQSTPRWRSSGKPLLDDQRPSAAAEVGLYPALIGSTPAAQARQLTLALHWDRCLPDDEGEPASLADCLRMQRAGDRGLMIRAYWFARQRTAEYQVLAEQAQWLENLDAVLASRRPRPLGPASLGRLRSARLAARADLFGAHLRLLESRFELTCQVGRPSASAWLLPVTAPYSGRDLPRLAVGSGEPPASRSLRPAAAEIPALAGAVGDRAAAVVEADTARAEASAKFHSGSDSVERLLCCTRRQTDQTLGLLASLTDYNQAIARYALAVLPADLPADELAQTLAVAR